MSITCSPDPEEEPPSTKPVRYTISLSSTGNTTTTSMLTQQIVTSPVSLSTGRRTWTWAQWSTGEPTPT